MSAVSQNRNIVITGASKGIGAACVRAFAKNGDTIYAISRNEAALQKMADDCHTNSAASIHCISADLADERQREALSQKIDKVDILLNNAGAITGGGLFDMSLDKWRENWELKVFGYIHLCQIFGQKMKANKQGTILNIIGMAGRDLRADYICGSSGNAALIAFTQALGAELQAHNVRVLGINPAATETDRVKTLYQQRAEARFGDKQRWGEMLDKDKLAFGRLKRAEEVASLALMCCDDAIAYLSGTVIDMDGGGRWI